MVVYAIRRSEDGTISVQGSYKKAYEAGLEYSRQSSGDFSTMLFSEFKRSLKKYRYAMISNTSERLLVSSSLHSTSNEETSNEETKRRGDVGKLKATDVSPTSTIVKAPTVKG